MLRFTLTICFGSLLLASSAIAEDPNTPMKFGMVIHGGAGTIDRSEMTPENEQAHRDGLEQSLKAGYNILLRGGSSLDAVEAAIRVLEDNPLFNAGRGAVFTHEGTN
jgi:beta-aspartyl-peptidase (threonine type)